MTIRSKMVLRATVERDTGTAAVDNYGGPAVPVWTDHLTSACWVYNDGKRLVVDGDKTVTVEALKIALPLGIDVTNSDRITEVKNRKGDTLFPGNFSINEIKRVHTHLEANLKVTK